MKYIYIVLFSLLITSCDSFLDKYPKDSFNDQTSFNSETDLKFFVNGFYDNLPYPQYRDDNNSDSMVPSTTNSLLSNNLSVPNSGGGWSIDDWSTIRKCNLFLSRYSNASVSDDIKNKYAGEIKLFRAMQYWAKLVRFGDVPIIEDYLTDASEALFKPRNEMKEVAKFILDDLEFALANVPEKSDKGRLNKDVVRALGSRINLWIGTYFKYHDELNYQDEYKVYLEKAKIYSQELMGKDYELYTEGDTPYRDLFIKTDLSDNKECILNRRFIIGLSTHNYTRESSESDTGVSKDFIEDYLLIDGTPIGNNFDDSTPVKEFAGRDPRLEQTVALKGFIWQDDEPAYNLPQIGTKTSTGYWLIKGRSSKKEKMISLNDDTDRFICRYAEVLLNYAEAKYELGELTNEDLDLSINLLRKRAGITTPLVIDCAPDPKGIEKYTNENIPAPSPILYEIRRERRIELIGEGFRFNDLKRWKAGPLINNPKTVLGMRFSDELRDEYEKANIDISQIKVNKDKYIQVYPSLANDKRKWLDKMYLFPLPLDQLAYKNNMGEFIYKQNSGW